jgi:hypothetical protein
MQNMLQSLTQKICFANVENGEISHDEV